MRWWQPPAPVSTHTLFLHVYSTGLLCLYFWLSCWLSLSYAWLSVSHARFLHQCSCFTVHLFLGHSMYIFCLSVPLSFLFNIVSLSAMALCLNILSVSLFLSVSLHFCLPISLSNNFSLSLYVWFLISVSLNLYLILLISLLIFSNLPACRSVLTFNVQITTTIQIVHNKWMMLIVCKYSIQS